MPEEIRLDAHPLDLPLLRPFTIARGTKTVARNVLVEVGHGGRVGRGEAAPNARYGQSQGSALAALRSFSPPPDCDPFEASSILEAFELAHPDQIAARAALEMALWDWAGQTLQRPLCRLLAIDPHSTPTSSYTISIDEPEALRARIEEARAWPVLKLKLGGGEADVRAVEQLRAVTARPFRVDANEAWDEEEAREKIAWLAGQDCQLVEQPLPAGALDAMARLKEGSGLPLVADEDAPEASAVADLARSYHGVNVKLTKTGGIRDAVQMIHEARRLGLSVMLGCFVESSLGISAAAHLSPLADWADLDGAALLARDPYAGARVTEGVISVPSTPGLGVRARADEADGREQ